MFSSKCLKISFISVVTPLLLSGCSNREAEASFNSITIQGGSVGGSYNNFIELLDKSLQSISIDALPSAGSGENLADLISDETNYAILQSDVIYKSFISTNSEYRELRAVAPLFSSYVQAIVRKSDNFQLLRDFEGKRISLGVSRSGTYQNAKDVMDLSGLVSGVNFVEVPLGSGPGLQALESNQVDVVFVSGAFREFDEDSPLQHFRLPPALIENLASREVFYDVTGTPDNFPALALSTYLVTKRERSSEEVGHLIGEMVNNWHLVQLEWPNVVQFDSHLAYQPFPFHSGAITEFVSLGLMVTEPNYLAIVLISSFIIFSVLSISKFRSTYNRIGRISYQSNPKQRIIDLVAQWGTPIMVLAGVILALAGFVWLIQLTEQSYAQINNTENLFSRVPFSEAIIWIFTFIVSGYPDIVFPSSPLGKFLLAMFALVGLLVPFGTVFGLFAVFTDYRSKQREGLLSYAKKRGHVVICGWNSRVPRVIYTLTGSDAPERKEIVVLANPTEKFPFNNYSFVGDVRYCRGEPSNRSALEKAGVMNAFHVIIVPTSNRRDEENLDSALAAISIRSLNQDVKITVEMEHRKNREYFETAGANIVVDPELISERMLVLACVNDLIVDFVLDILTFDKYTEWYCYRLGYLNRQHNWNVMLPAKANDLFHESRSRGTPAIGVVTSVKRNEGLLDANFKDDLRLRSMLSKDEMQIELGEQDALILAAEDSQHLDVSLNHQSIQHDIDNDELELEISIDHRVVAIVGPENRSASLERALVGKFGISEIVHVDTNTLSSKVDEQLVTIAGREDIACVYFLGFENLHEVRTESGAFRRDAETIVRAKLVKSFSLSYGNSPRVIAELNLVDNRKNFVDAGVDTILPYGLVSERFLTKTVYGKGDVSDFILALVTFEDSTGLLQHIVNDSSPLLGRLVSEIIGLKIGDSRVVGLLPKSNSREYEEVDDYFDTHFMLSGSESDDQTVQIGDRAIVVSSRIIRNTDYSDQIRRYEI